MYDLNRISPNEREALQYLHDTPSVVQSTRGSRYLAIRGLMRRGLAQPITTLPLPLYELTAEGRDEWHKRAIDVRCQDCGQPTGKRAIPDTVGMRWCASCATADVA